MNLTIASFILLGLTFYYLKTQSIIEKNLGLIFISTLQGIIIALWRDNILDALFIGLIYFTLIKNIRGNVEFSLASKENYANPYLISSIKKFSILDKVEFDIKKFKGKNSFTAGTPFHWPKTKKYRIFLGEKLISKLDLDETLFVVWHECKHIIKNHHIKFGLFSMIIIIMFGTLFRVIYLILIKNHLIVISNGFSFFILGTLMFVLALLMLGKLAWQYESEADIGAIKETYNKKSAQSAFKKLLKFHPLRDYGPLLNLLFYNHPLTVNRIREITSLDLEKNSR